MTSDPGRRRGRLRGIFLDLEPLRRDRDYRFLWAGQLISGVGRQVTVVALPFQLYVLTGSTLAVGLLALVQLVPILVFALGGGAMADAVDRRRLLLLTQLGLAVASAALFGLAMTPGAPIWGYYVVAFVAAGVGAVDQPARTSSIPRLVPLERLPAAIALNQLGFNTMAVIGPALGGLLIVAVGVATAFLFDAVTFAAAIVALLLIAPIPPHPGAARPSLDTVREGLRFVRGRRVVLSSFVVDLVAMVFGMPTSLFPALALDVFGVGPAGVGLLTAAPAAGALIGAATSGWVGRIARPGRAVIVSVAGWGAAITAFGVTTFMLVGSATLSFALALVFLACAGAADVFSAVLRSAIVQLDTPDQLRGRVASIHILVVTSGPRLGDAEAAAVAAITSPELSVLSGGILCLVGLAAVARRFPELARYVYPAARPPEPVP
jgi:MFS family permease